MTSSLSLPTPAPHGMALPTPGYGPGYGQGYGDAGFGYPGYPGYGTYGAPGSGAAGGNPLSLRLIVGILRRRWLMIGTCITAITAGSVAYALQQPNAYEADAQLLIGVPNTTTLDLGNFVAGLPVNQERIQNEIQLLRSRALARAVVIQAGLEDHLAADEPGFVGRIKAMVPSKADVLRFVGLSDVADVLEPPTAGLGRDPMDGMVDAFLGELDVWPEARSHVINLRFTSQDPAISARAVNTLAEVYLADRVDEKLATARRASGWLDERLEVLRAEAEKKEGAVEAYRSEYGLVEGEGSSLTAERIAELNRALAVAEAAKAQASARYQRVRQNGAAALTDVLNSGTIQNLRQQEGIAVAQRAELSRELGPRHPRMIELTAQLEGIRSQIQAEIQRTLVSLESEYEIAEARASRIESEIQRLEAQILDRNDSEAALRVLEREALAAQEVYRDFLLQANSNREQEVLQAPEGRLIAEAEIPANPAGPNRKAIALLGFLFSCFTGVGAAVALELVDRRFRTADQIRDRLRMPVFGVVPMLSSLGRTRRSPEDQVAHAPDSAFGEAIRSLRTSFSTLQDHPSPRVILMTSSVQGEGKTTLCVSTGRHAALGGRRVILVDCDFRLPRVHRSLHADNQAGVIDHLEGTPLSELIQVDQSTGMHFVTAGRWRRSAPELLRSTKLKEMISLLRRRYDMVLIDTPPVMPVSDACAIAALADLSVLVVGWGKAEAGVVEGAAARLRTATADAALGAVFNNVDLDQVQGYGFAEVDAYRGAYGRYYAMA